MKSIDKFMVWKTCVREYAGIGTMRQGQAYMNALADVDKPLYDKITGTLCDCFHEDSKCPAFVDALFAAWGDTPSYHHYTQEDAQEMASMIDGAYEIVELWGYGMKEVSPYNVLWAKEWLEKARKFGASPDWG